MQFEHQTIAGHDLRISRVSRGGRPTVVMTNAFPQSIRCWESLWERLRQRFDLLAVDLAGFGMSGGGGSIMRPSAQSELLVELMNVNGIEQAYLIGPDVGVPISLWLASTHPERLLGVNIYDGPGMWPTDFAPALRAATRSRLVRWLGTRWPLQRPLMKQNFAAATSGGYHHFEPSPAAVDEYRGICFDPVKHRNAFDFLGSYAEELPLLQERLSSIEVPVLITWGAHDDFVRPGNGKQLHARLPNSKLEVLENAGHFSHEDADEAWLERFMEFVASCEVAGTTHLLAAPEATVARPRSTSTTPPAPTR